MLRRLSPVFLTLLLLSIAAGALAEPIEHEFTFDTAELKVVNLIGAVRVVATTGDEFRVRVAVNGKDASEDFLQFKIDDDGGDVLTIAFPLDEYKKYVYPELGRHSKTTIHFEDDRHEGRSWLKHIFSGWSGTKVTVRGKGNGREVWADVTIEMPARSELAVKLGVGSIEADKIQGDLDLDTSSGAIAVRDLLGDLIADTGSGQVDASGVVGSVNIDTGSGRVEVADCEGPDIKVDTGSGGVVANDLICTYLLIDTGSGGVKSRQVSAERAKVDTGSGSVLLELSRMGDGDFVVDTGSGSITLVLPSDASARISADTGSGGMHNEYSGAEVLAMSRDEMELVVGDGAARVMLDAGSGSITVREK